MSAIKSHLPLLKSLEGYSAPIFRDDFVAGLTTAIMLIPQAMAYAMLGGLDPIVGLYASTVPLVLYALFGTSRQLAVGPAAMISLLVASGVGGVVDHGDAGAFAAAAGLLALMVGLLQWGMGAARLGFIVKFLSQPVIAGFTSATALIIGASQIKHILGLEIPRSQRVDTILLAAAGQLGETNLITLGIAAVCAALLMVLKRRAPRFPRFLTVVVGGAVAVWALGLDQRGVAIVGEVPGGLPAPSLPVLDLGLAKSLLPTAVTIALVGFMQAISIAKNFARIGGYEVDASQELRGLGLANIGAALSGGYPVTGGLSRTAVKAQAGARTGVASIVTAAAVAVTLLFLTPLFHYLPKAALAAIITTAVLGLVDLREARRLWRISRPDLALMGLTFVATLGLGIEQGILLGVAANLLWFIWQTSKPHIAVLGRLPGSTVYRNVARNEGARETPGVLAVRVDAPLYFANTAFLKRSLCELEAAMGEPLRALVLDAKAIGSVDASGAALLEELVRDYRDRGVEVWIAGVRGPVKDVLVASGLARQLGAERFVHRVHEAVDRFREARSDAA